VKTLLLAGHDSAAHAVVFALYFLSQRPDWQARVREEAAWLEQPRPLVATASRMVNTEAVVSEAMRLLPPIWAIERRAIEEIDVLGCRLPKGSAIVLSPYVTQRHPQFWPEPNEFRPERFLNVDPSRHRYAYFPFGGGSRLCVGNHVGLLQLKVALGTILSRYQIALAPDFQYVFKNLVVLRFLHGLPLHLTPVT
jgi:cytochrome P450